jgi:hypothetical protein
VQEAVLVVYSVAFPLGDTRPTLDWETRFSVEFVRMCMYAWNWASQSKIVRQNRQGAVWESSSSDAWGYGAYGLRLARVSVSDLKAT